MEIKLKLTEENGLITQFITNLNKRTEKRKIKEKTYTSKQYYITVPTAIAEIINNNKIFLKQISQTKYIILENEEDETISLNLRESKTKKYTKYILTLPKKFFNFLDSYYDEESKIIFNCYEKENKIHIFMELI